jgi:hypothetical protein|tara:strand:+ start:1252 stop:1743 length:492 start_codon:yes stop_codon:yes gene_type:complete
MKLITGKRINIILLFILFLYSGCNRSVEQQLIGEWEIDYVTFSDGSSSTVPVNEKYTLLLQKNKNKNIFNVDNVYGSWNLQDSTLFFENIPESKTLIDSIYVVNDKYGNSSLILQNGDQKIASIENGQITPEKVISKMKIISVNLEQLNLLIEKDIHTYTKLN